MAMNPLHQFEVVPVKPLMLGGWDLTITNQVIWTGIAVAALIVLMVAGITRMRMVPGRWQALVEMVVEFGRNLVRDVVGEGGEAFFPLILTLFLFLCGVNLVGMIPHGFSASSQVTITAFMGCMVFLLVVGVGVYVQGMHFFGMFLPHGTPWWLAPLIVPLEIISFLVRPFTLAVRLSANMVAGHVMLKLFASFAIMLLGIEGAHALTFNYATAAGAVLPAIVLVILSALEVFVALLQAFIFTILSCVYLNEAMHGH